MSDLYYKLADGMRYMVEEFGLGPSHRVDVAAVAAFLRKEIAKTHVPREKVEGMADYLLEGRPNLSIEVAACAYTLKAMLAGESE
jgi:hypothetical protein